MSELTDMNSTLRRHLEDIASPRVPDYLDEMLARTARTRQRRVWLVRSWWLPAWPSVGGSSYLRQAILLALVALLAIAMMGAAVVGSQLLRQGRPVADLETVATLPWQPRPLEPAPGLLAWLDDACGAAIRRHHDPAASPNRWLVDVRGGGFIVAYYGEDPPFSWPSGNTGYCYVKISPGRAPELLQQVWAPPAGVGPRAGLTVDPNPQEPNSDYGAPDDHHGPLDAFVPIPLSIVWGRVAPEVERVEAVLDSGRRVEATVSGTTYTLWLPAVTEVGKVPFQRVARYEAFDADGRLLVGVAAPTPQP